MSRSKSKSNASSSKSISHYKDKSDAKSPKFTRVSEILKQKQLSFNCISPEIKRIQSGREEIRVQRKPQREARREGERVDNMDLPLKRVTV